MQYIRPKEPLAELEFALHRMLTHVFLICDFLFASRIYRVIGASFMQPLLLGCATSIIAFYVVYAMIRGRFAMPIACSCYIALVMNQLSVFAGKLWIPINVNAFFQYIWMLSFVPFVGLCLSGGRAYLLRCVAFYGTIYCSIYAIASAMQIAGVLPGKLLEALVSSHDSRGARIFMYFGLGCFSYFYWLVQIRTKATHIAVAGFAICALASILSLSRVYLLLVTVMTLLFLFQPRPAIIRRMSICILICGGTFVLSGMVFHAFNPFNLFAADTSGAYRALEYTVVRQRLWMDPIWGFGLSSDIDLTKPFLGSYLIFSADLGPLGIWFDFGIIGLAMYFVALVLCCRPPKAIPYEYGWPLFLTGCIMTAYGCMSPVATSPGGAMMTGLILATGLTANGLARRKSSGSVPGKVSHARSRIPALPAEFDFPR
ncbi:hypothetical protein MRBLMR1_004983 [Neorhizobium sp. LMR1-1-1.1]